jgi:hypothetical protein
MSGSVSVWDDLQRRASRPDYLARFRANRPIQTRATGFDRFVGEPPSRMRTDLFDS